MNFPDPAIIHEAMILMDLKNSVKHDNSLAEFRNELDKQIVALCEAFAKELMNAKQ